MTVNKPVPPSQRTPLGEQLTTANPADHFGLRLQHCQNCQTIQYPPRELCRNCLQDDLVWQETKPEGILLSKVELHHSHDVFFQQNLPWLLSLVKLSCGVIAYAHLAPSIRNLPIEPGTKVKVFCHPDDSGEAVLIAISDDRAINSVEDCETVMTEINLLQRDSKT